MTLISRFVAVETAALLFASCATLPETATRSHDADSVVTRVVTDGVVHRRIIRESGPWNIHSVAIDLKRPELDIISAHAFDSLRGRETTSAIARRLTNENHTVVAAINADFFNMETGGSELSQVVEEEILKAVKKPLRAQFALGYSRKPYIEKFVFDGTAVTLGETFSIDAINSLKDSALVLLNHFWGSYMRSGPESVVLVRKIRASGDTTIAVMVDSLREGEQFMIGHSLLLLRAKGLKRAGLARVAVGDTVLLVLRFLPASERIKTLVGGLPRIVREGRNVALPDSMPELTAKFTETRHPRTGVGFSRDGSTVYLVTVDGRQQSSVGMSLVEFGDLMMELGCYQALNLDGGGSTTMVVVGKVVNAPSDASGERPVANVLLVVKENK
jgi:hypothetical protein